MVEAFGLRVALVGWRGSGKSTLMEALVGNKGTAIRERSGVEYRVGTAPVPDPRLDYLAGLYKPRKLTPAPLEFADLPGIAQRGMEHTVQEVMRTAEVLLLVLGAFSGSGGDAARDYRRLEEEFLLADLSVVEGRLDRLAHQKGAHQAAGYRGTSNGQVENEVLQRCRVHLEGGRPLRTLDIDGPVEQAIVDSYRLLSRKPALAVVNVSEEQLADGGAAAQIELATAVQAVREQAGETGVVPLDVCASLEAEISVLPAEERSDFLAEFGLAEPGVARVARAAYAAAGLISFFTVGPDEIKAWVLRRGATAWEAAGKIHSDIQRGFIRAEVVAFQDLQRAGDMKAAKAQNQVRLEGKDYVVQDGDIIEFRFNV